MKITLDQLLASREHRHDKQVALLGANPGCTLMSLTVIMPGPVKRNSHSLIVANAALTAVLECFRGTIKDIEVHDRTTGYEAFIVTTMSNDEAKRLACKIEDEHPLGRLFDIDIIAADGAPISRTAIGQLARRCLICDQEARFCMRNHTHTQAEIQQTIDKMIDRYVQ